WAGYRLRRQASQATLRRTEAETSPRRAPARPSHGRNISGVRSGLPAMQNKDRPAVLGAGHAGPVIPRLAIAAGYPVAIATSGDPDDIALITELVIPGARPRWAGDAIADADIVVLAIPLHRFAELDPGRLAGKIVVDAMNYWPASDGVLTAFEDGGTNSRGSSEIVARRLAGS